MQGAISIFTGTSNRPLAEKVCLELSTIRGEEIGLSKVCAERFSDGEVAVRIGVDCFDDEVLEDDSRGRDAFIIQSTQTPGDFLLELELMIDALSRRSPRRITAVIPYFGYARQDRKDKSGKPISAYRFARDISDSFLEGVIPKVVLVDIHSDQIEGFFTVPVDRLYASYVFIPFIRSLNLGSFLVVAPDAGSLNIARFHAKQLGQDVVFVDKRRFGKNQAEVMNVIGEVKEGSTAVIIDDMVDTAGTFCKAAAALSERGATKIVSCCTHPVLSGPAIESLVNSPIEKLYVADTIPLKKEASECDKIEVVSVAGLIACAIDLIHEERSLSRLVLQ